MTAHNPLTYVELYADAYSAYKDCQAVCHQVGHALYDFDGSSKNAKGCSRAVLRAMFGEDESQLLMLSKYGLTPTERAVVACGYLVSMAAALLPIAINHANRAMTTVAYAKAVYPEITKTIQKKYAGRQILRVLPPNETGRFTDMGTLQLACIQMTRKAISSVIDANERFIEMTESVFDTEGTLAYLMPGLNAVDRRRHGFGQTFEWQIPSPRLLDYAESRVRSVAEEYDNEYPNALIDLITASSNHETDFITVHSSSVNIAGMSLKETWKKVLDTMERGYADALVRHYASLLDGYQKTSTQQYPISIEEAAQLITAQFIQRQTMYGGVITNRDTPVKKAIKSALAWRENRQAFHTRVASLGSSLWGISIYDVTSEVPDAVARTNRALCAYYGAINRAPIDPGFMATEQTLPTEFRVEHNLNRYKNRGKTALLTCEKAFDLLCKWATL